MYTAIVAITGVSKAVQYSYAGVAQLLEQLIRNPFRPERKPQENPYLLVKTRIPTGPIESENGWQLCHELLTAQEAVQ